MIGPVNSPHMEDLALALKARGHTVEAGGSPWAGGLPPTSLPGAGIPVSAMTSPQPLWARRLIRSFRPDLVHVNWMPFALAPALAGAKPMVVMAWGSDVYLASRAQLLTYRLAIRRARLCMADSAALLDRLVELGAPRDQTALLNWGVNLHQFRPPSPGEREELRAELGLAGGPVVMSPRGFKDIYNPGVVIDAFARVLADVPDVQLVLKHQTDVGPELGPLSGDPRVHVIGRVPYERMADYFRASDICVSIPTSDSSPRSVWEAMACGCACVLSDLPWVHELIQPAAQALVVRPDPAAVAGAITRLLLEPDVRGAIASSARKLVETERDAEREMDRLEALYYSLVEA